MAIQALSPLLPAGASIVNIGSIAALTAHYPVAYTTSKWARTRVDPHRRTWIGGTRDSGQHRPPRIHRHPDDRVRTRRVPLRLDR